MRILRCYRLLAASLALVSTLALSPARAQDDGSGQESDPGNFVHPPGTATVPLGVLGEVEIRGDGPVPLVLLPGASFTWEVWEPFMERNVERYTMMAVTPPGNGDTAPPPMPADPDDFSDHVWTDAFLEAVAERVREEGMESPVVVGHHLLGDHYALRLALEYPELFRGAVVVAGVPSRVMRGSDGSIEGQIEVVESQWIPFFRDVTWERWLQGTYKAAGFSVDADHGEELYQRQISTPLPTQLRYYLEFLTTNTALDLPQLQVPLLVVNRDRDAEALIERAVAATAEDAGGEEAARDRIHQQLVDTYGSLEAGKEAMRAGPWGPQQQRVRDLRIEFLAETGLFIMDDRAEAFDELLWDFVQGLEEG